MVFVIICFSVLIMASVVSFSIYFWAKKEIEKQDKFNITLNIKDEPIEEFIEDYYEEHTGIYFNIKKKLISLKKMEAVL